MTVKLHHIGIGVKSLEDTVSYFKRALNLEPFEYVMLSGSKAALFKVGDVILEFIEPDDHPVNQAGRSIMNIVSTTGGGIQHLAFELADFDKAVQNLKDNDLNLNEEGVRDGKHGRFAWLEQVRNQGYMIELCEKDYKIG